MAWKEKGALPAINAGDLTTQGEILYTKYRKGLSIEIGFSNLEDPNGYYTCRVIENGNENLHLYHDTQYADHVKIYVEAVTRDLDTRYP